MGLHTRRAAWKSRGIITTLGLSLALTGGAQATTVYVDATVLGGDGLTWQTAYASLQDALDEARTDPLVTEIRVAAGTYTPGLATADTFELVEGVTVFGGYAGTSGMDPDLRNPVVNVTTLSGTLTGGLSSHHVVTAPSVTTRVTRLDGFTITGGRAEEVGSPDDRGGGLLADLGSPTVSNCNFVNNRATRGGAVGTLSVASPLIENCIFDGNSAAEGGAVHSEKNGSGAPELVGCLFTSNTAQSFGGAIWTRRGLFVVNSVFTGNSVVSGRGGAVFSDDNNGNPRLINCTVSGNSVVSGRGGAVASNSTLGIMLIQSSILWGNSPDEVDSADIGFTTSIVQDDPLASDPLLASDLSILQGSPAIDQGTDSLLLNYPVDFVGNQRLLDDPDVPNRTVGQTENISDIGAYERIPNTPPTADLFVEQLTNIGTEAVVRLDATMSSDDEEDFSQLALELLVDGTVTICGPASGGTCGVVETTLPFGTSVVTLRVTDSLGATDEISQSITIDAAALSVLAIERLRVEFDDGTVKYRGDIGLPTGVDFEAVAPLALVSVGVGDLVTVPPTPIVFATPSARRWKFVDADASLGISVFRIDWKGARFKFKETGLPVKLRTEMIASDETILTYKFKPRRFDGPVTMDIGGLATVVVDEDGNVTSADVPYEEERAGREIILTLPFPLLEDTVITFSGGVERTVLVGDHYRLSTGRYKLKTVFDPALFPDGVDTAPREVDLTLSIGEQFYDGATMLDATEISVNVDRGRWEDG